MLLLSLSRHECRRSKLWSITQLVRKLEDAKMWFPRRMVRKTTIRQKSESENLEKNVYSQQTRVICVRQRQPTYPGQAMGRGLPNYVTTKGKLEEKIGKRGPKEKIPPV